MREPNHGRQRLPGYLSHSEVLDVLKKGIRENPNEAILDLRGRTGWLESTIIAGKTTALTGAGWSALSKTFSFPCVETPRSLTHLARRFLTTDPKQGISPESLTSIEKLITTIECRHPNLSFRELSSLCTFVVSLGRHDYTDGHRGIDALQRRLDAAEATQDTMQAVLSLAFAYLTVPQGAPLSHIESFRRRMRIALQTGDDVPPVRAGLFYLEASELPEAQRTVLSRAWDQIECHFTNVRAVVQEVSDSIRELKRINDYLGTLPSTLSTPESVAEAISHQFKHTREVSAILTPLDAGQRLSGPDADFALEKLAQGMPPAQISNLIKFSRLYAIALREVPTDLAIAPTALQQLLRHEKVSPTTMGTQSEVGAIRSMPEVLRLVELLSPLLRSGEDNSKLFGSFIELYDRVQADPRLWSSKLAVNFARRCAKKEIPVVQEKDVQEFRLALATHHRLLKAGHPPEQASQIAWVYATHEHYRADEFTDLRRALFQASPDEGFTREMRTLAKNPDTTEDEFRQAVIFAAKAFPDEWGKIRALYSARWGGFVTFFHLRKAIAQSEKTQPRELRNEVARHLESLQASEIRHSLITFLQSQDAAARTQAGNKLNTIYRTDQGPYPVFTDATTIHPGYRNMMTQVKGIYRGCFDMHYGFGHSTFECKTPPGTPDWMLIRFGFDIGVRVDRLHSHSSDLYPGPGCIISGMKLDRVFAKNPYTPEDPYYLFKKSWSWAAQEFEDLELTRFLFSRAVRGVVGPNLPQYHLDGVHYSLVVWNDHFLNPNLDAAALVPTKVLMAALRGKHSEIRALGQTPALGHGESVHDDALTLSELATACETQGLNLLNLGWASNLGGLCNAYPPLSAPYFEWERKLVAHSKDRAGHVHKAHISGHYVWKMNEETERLLIPLREAHDHIHKVSSAYLNLHDLFRLSLAMWHKGLTVTEELGEMAEPEFTQDNDPQLSAQELRMLHEAYRWHQLHERGVTEKDAFPVLCIAPTLDNWSRVYTPFMLDTFDMSMRVANEEHIQLPRDTGGHGAFEATVWSKLVKPLYYTRADRDLRFLDRRSVTYDDTQTRR